MILGDKIIALRRQLGWSQEQLAEEMGISRQSVSKWESGMSIPDIDKILKLSEIFGVSTDYLLREEIEVAQPSEGNTEVNDGVRQVSAEEASEYMEVVESVSEKIAAGVALFILSPVLMIVLAGIAEYVNIGMSEDVAGGIGVAVLLVIVVIGVFIEVYFGMKLSPYEYLEKEEIKLDYGVAGIVDKKRKEYAPKFRLLLAVGIVMCIVGVIPLTVAGAFDASDIICICLVGVLLVCCAVGVFFIVNSTMVWESYQKLLQAEDYSVRNKQVNKKVEALSGAYWCIVTAIFLGISLSGVVSWGISWVIWPVAAVLYGAVSSIVSAFVTEK